MMRRRQFLYGSSGLLGASCLLGSAACHHDRSSTQSPTGAGASATDSNTAMSAGSKEQPAANPSAGASLFQISLAQWSLHRAFFATDGSKRDPLDFAMIARGYGIDAIEYVNSFFKDKAKDQAYLTELKNRADGEGVKSLLIMCDGEGDVGDADASKRTTAVENHYRWIEAAKFLGAHSIRVNARSSGTREEQVKLAADGLRRLCEFSDSHGINVIVENHGGLSSDGSWLAEVMRTVAHPRCGTLPDFGNFRIDESAEYDRYLGVKELMPFAKAVSAKTHDFDEQGEEKFTDYARMMKIVLDAGYRGYVGVEYEGDRLSEDEGIRATKSLLERVRTQLATQFAA